MGEFTQPFAVCVNSKGHILVADASNSRRIQIFDKEGKFITKFGSKRETKMVNSRVLSQLLLIMKIIFMWLMNNVIVFKSSTQMVPFILRQLDKKGSGDGEFEWPAALYIDNETGNIFCCGFWKSSNPDL